MQLQIYVKWKANGTYRFWSWESLLTKKEYSLEAAEHQDPLYVVILVKPPE